MTTAAEERNGASDVTRARENPPSRKPAEHYLGQRPNRQNSPSPATLRLTDLACGFQWAAIRLLVASLRCAPIAAPATPARSRAGCSSSPHSPLSANSHAAPRPDNDSVRDVPDG